MSEEREQEIAVRLARVEERLSSLASKVDSIYGAVKWVGAAVGGAVIVALMQLVLK